MHVEERSGSESVHGLVSFRDRFAHSHADLEQGGFNLFGERASIGQLLNERRAKGLINDRGVVVRGYGEELLGFKPPTLVQRSISRHLER